jgi:hypothetical protein
VKIAEEAVARYCAREFDLPITIARMGSAYGDRGGLPLWHLNAIAEGKPVVARWDPLPYSPIHYDDINAHVEALLGAALPITIRIMGGGACPAKARMHPRWTTCVEVVPGASIIAGDRTKRTSITAARWTGVTVPRIGCITIPTGPQQMAVSVARTATRRLYRGGSRRLRSR